LTGSQGVVGSNPTISTTIKPHGNAVSFYFSNNHPISTV